MGVSFGDYVPKVRPKREEKVNETVTDFVVYPRYWQDTPSSCSYGFDWKRDKDDFFSINSKSKSEITGSFIQGESFFEKNYDSAKTTIDGGIYFSPFLMMFQNHRLVTGKEVVLSLHILYKEIKKVKNKKIYLDYDTSILDVGFTNNGETISQTDYTIDKKYFEKDFFSESKFETYVFMSENRIVLNNLMVKCKQNILQDTLIKFLDENKKIVGSIIVKANDAAIFSKRNFNYIKLKRKSSNTRDLEIIKNKILTADTYDNNGKIVEFDNENNVLKHFTENIVKNGYSKLLVNFRNEYELNELEIDDEFLIKEGIISETSVLKSNEYLKHVQEKYFSSKNYSEEQINTKNFFFISPIDGIPSVKKTCAFVVYEKLKIFSAMVYVFQTEHLVHEMGHEMGLNHTFESSKEDLDSKKKYLLRLQEYDYFTKTEILIAKWKIDLKNRTTSGYPFDFENQKIINKKKWGDVIVEKETEFKKEKSKHDAEISNTEELLRYLKKMDEYHQIYFKEKSTDNFMDYDTKYGFFYYQFEIIKKLNDEFKHI